VLLAHLQRRSVTVRRGEQVEPGARMARCGNSGNSSEPHLHPQLMDWPWPLCGAGLPFVYTDVGLPGTADRTGVPGTGDAMIAETELRA
jgi:murein DD-endopeptidase MepM/ murein hydrolase activator NlpD